MRNGKILGWAWGPVLLTGLAEGMERASQPAVGLGGQPHLLAPVMF